MSAVLGKDDDFVGLMPIQEEAAMAKEAKESSQVKAAQGGTIPARRQPLSALPRLEQEFERFFGRQRPWRFDWPVEFSRDAPKVDVLERDSDVVVRAELPGFKKEDIDVSLSDSRVTIKAESETESKEEDGDYYHREISRGYVSRTVDLPCDVVGDDAKARLDDGMLEITVPKAAKSKRKSIKIDA